MTTTDNDQLRGVLFKNDPKQEDSHPDYKGETTVKGQQSLVLLVPQQSVRLKDVRRTRPAPS